MSAEIQCPGCGKETLLLRTPRYEGFKRTGEDLSCAACGHAFATEADVPYREEKKVSIFTEADRSAVVDVFKDDPRGRLCRYCAHYVVNPFRQWCGVHRKEVEATHTCDRFEPRPPPKDPLAAVTGGVKPPVL